MIRFLSRRWRDDLAGVASSATRSMIVAAPFIKDDEAAWLCERLNPDVGVLTLANVDARAVSESALDIAALRRLAAASADSRLIALSGLHAKAYVADEAAAIITSGNLTSSALDRNIEYGVWIDEPPLVRTVRQDMLSFARLGSEVDEPTFDELAPVETELRRAQAEVERSASRDARRRFDAVMREARPVLAGVQVGDRRPNAVFGEAIRLALAGGPLPTGRIHEAVRRLLPALCDDEELVIKGERYGKVWKHRVRNAQQQLKRSGAVEYDRDTGLWRLANPMRP